ncbi:MAG: DUF6570 domain-containing protein [Chryseotalea sp.]
MNKRLCKHEQKEIAKRIIKQIEEIKVPTNGTTKMICKTCKDSVLCYKFPRLWLGHGLEFNEVPDCLKVLNDVEAQLCCPRVAFIRIKPLGWDKQSGILGNVVNVPVNVEKTLNMLPVNFKDSKIIQLNFMRKIDYTKPYMRDTVRPKIVIEAVKYLTSQKLYKDNAIIMSNEWLDKHKTDKEDFVVETDDEDAPDQGNDTIMSDSSSGSDSEEDDELENNPLLQVNDTVLINKNIIEELKIAPAEKNSPISLHKDKHGEELTFLKIHGGQAKKTIEKRTELSFTEAAECKSYFRRYDRRCAENIQFIFYKLKKLLAEKLNSAISIAIKKHSLSVPLTARQAIDDATYEAYLKSEEAKRFLRTVRSTPEYWAMKMQQVMAMNRQLGPGTFFTSLSPIEIDWPELIKILAKVLDNLNLSLDEADQLDKETKIDYLRRDPVTVARYFEYRREELLKYILNRDANVFSGYHVKDYFYRVEFQARGSPHIHMILWLEDAPIYNRHKPQCEDNQKCIEMIDMLITCKHDPKLYDENYEAMITESQALEILSSRQEKVINEKYDAWSDKTVTKKVYEKCMNYQMHVHRDNCLIDDESLCYDNELANEHDEENEKVCKYGFPWPILDQTLILQPILKPEAQREGYDIQKLKSNYKEIKSLLNEYADEFRKYLKKRKRGDKNAIAPKVITQKACLTELGMSYIDYVLAIRCNLKRITVFNKRTSYDIMMNPYNLDILMRHRGNMDIQFIPDPYGLIMYVTSYMMKSNAVMSRVLHTAADEITKRKNMTIRQRLNVIAGKFQNCAEMSAQEAVYHLLSMPVAKASREVTFIMTFRQEQRYSMLKSKENLELVCRKNPNSMDIYIAGIIEHYIARPEEFEKMCLAEFVAWYDFVSCTRYKRIMSTNAYEIMPNEQDDMNDDNYDDIYLDVGDASQTSTGSNASVSPDENEDCMTKKRQKLCDKTYYPIGFGNKPQGYVTRREQFKILRFRRFNREKQPQEYYREQLMLFLPWRNEQQEIEHVVHIDRFNDNKHVIAQNRNQFQFANTTEDVLETLQQLERELRDAKEREEEARALELLQANRLLMRSDFNDLSQDPLTVEEEEELEEAFGFQADFDLGTVNLVSINDEPTVVNIQDPLPLTKDDQRRADDNFKRVVTALNRLQHKFFINTIYNLKKRDPVQFFSYLAGDSGTGKSHLIKAINLASTRFFKAQFKRDKHIKDNDPATPLINLLTAFTGKEAFNIRGQTLHLTFGLPVGSSQFRPLSDEALKKMSKHLKFVRLIIIDEISMVGAAVFENINARLNQIFLNMNGKHPFKSGVKPLNKQFRDVDSVLGDLPIIVVGDLKQLCPVSDCFIFRPSKSCSYSKLNGNVNYLWSLFRLFELKEIMRQRDDARFALALRRIGEDNLIGLNDEQIEMLNSRIVDSYDQVPNDAMILMFKNADTNAFNEKKIKSLPGTLIECEALHKAKDGSKTTERIIKENLHSLCKACENNSGFLSYSILLKCGCKYMITKNLNVIDGLFNGTAGTLKAIVMDTKEKRPKTLWFDFHDEDIGRMHRMEKNDYLKRKYAVKDIISSANYQAGNILFDSDVHDIDFMRWTPIEESSAIMRIGHQNSYQIYRYQFPLVECEALSIHKSQGQTYKKIAFDLKQTGLTRALKYVAMSRVTTLNGLYLIGKTIYNKTIQSIIEGEKFEKWTDEKRRKEIESARKTSNIWSEMDRMRSKAPFENQFPFLETDFNKKGNSATCMFHNIGNGLKYNTPFIQNDFGFQSCDFIMLIECHIQVKINEDMNLTRRDYPLDGYTLLRVTGGTGTNCSHGSCMYVKNDRAKRLNAQFVADNSKDQNGIYSKESVELSLFSFDHPVTKERVYILFVYNHPSSSVSDLYKELTKFINDNLTPTAEEDEENVYMIEEKLVIVGDFNFNVIEKENRRRLKNMMRVLNLELAIEKMFDLCSTNRHTLIDWCMTNIHDKNNYTNNQLRVKSMFYESVFSDHKPIWFSIDSI